MEKCNHKWINAKDGTIDKICIICGKRAMQGVLYFQANKPNTSGEIEININISDDNSESMIKEINRKIIKNIYFNPQKGAES